MKIKVITLATLFCGLIAVAAPVTPEQALARLSMPSNKHLLANRNISPRLSLSASLNQLYIFSDNEQFVITPADDSAPALLGYGPKVDVDNLPPALDSFLKSYADQIKWLAENPQSLRSRGSDYDEVSPLLITRWNQSAPFFNQCPRDGVNYSVTGCVATAMAQIMKFHEWPREHGYGSHSYEWKGQTLTCDFESTTFDWDNMLPDYGTSYNTVQANAVATLMKACGVSVDMNYSASTSGAYSYMISQALVDYFGYDKGTAFLLRECFDDDEWFNLIYSELEQGRPVYYSGASTQPNSGHAFVCDGYKGNGYFHINWGWGGNSDGYFLLSVLDPYEQGIGGSGSGFNIDQQAIIGIQPAIANSELHMPFYSNGGLEWNSESSAFYFGKSGDGAYLGYFNYSNRDVNAYAAIKLTSGSGETYMAEEGVLRTYKSYTGFSLISPTFPDDLPAGDYTATPVVRLDGSSMWQPVRIPVGMTQSITVRKGQNGALTYDGSDPEDYQLPLSISVIEQRDDWFNNGSGNFRININNGSNSTEDLKLAFVLRNKETAAIVRLGNWNVSINPNYSGYLNLLWPTVTLEEGVYTIRALDLNRNASYISEPNTILVGVRPTSILCSAPKSTVQVGETMHLNASVLPDNTPFKNVVWTASNDAVSIDDDGTLTAMHIGDVIVTGTTLNNLKHQISLKIEETAAIDDVVSDPGNLPVDVYNLQGIILRRQVKMSEATIGLPDGVYIVNGKKVMVRAN